MNAIRETDPDLQKLFALLTAWHDLLPSACTIKRALEEARSSSKDDEQLKQRRVALIEAMEDVASDRNNINPRKLGKWISDRANKIINGLRFENVIGAKVRAVRCAGGAC